MADPICEQCGFPLSSRTHLEGRNGIHDAPASEAEAVEETSVKAPASPVAAPKSRKKATN